MIIENLQYSLNHKKERKTDRKEENMKELVYQMYLFCYLGEGEGESPIQVATKRLEHVKELGTTTVWLGPIFESPWRDHGYDIKNYYSIEPRFGTIEDFDSFVSKAHSLGMKVIIDLVLNHASTECFLFTDKRYRQEYFITSDKDHPGQTNLFDGGPAWHFDEDVEKYSLSLFSDGQRDFLWFPEGPEGDINEKVVRYFYDVIDYWTMDYNVDGFRIDIPQSINKDFRKENWNFDDEMAHGDLSIRVLKTLFGGGSKELFLIVELFDPTMTGELVKRYVDETPVNYVLNVLLKEQMTPEVAASDAKRAQFWELVERYSRISGFMLDLESHDSCRFPSRGIDYVSEVYNMCNCNPPGICLYNGQEFGLENLSKLQLPDLKILELDAQARMRALQGVPIDQLRRTSRANARVSLPPFEELRHSALGSSRSRCTRDYISRWQEL